MKRDDVFEYSLYNHHTDEEGVNKRKKLWGVFWLLLLVTIVEVGLGFIFSRTPSMKTFLFITFIALTIAKAFYIVMTFMHLGDETKSFKWAILAPFILFILYLIYIIITEANFIYNMNNFFGWAN